MSKFENPPAFPVHGDNICRWDGMSLRDWFAGKALDGWMASYGEETDHPCQGADYVPQNIARWSYQIADAMLAERSKP